MKIRIISLFLVVCVLCSLCSCFPTVENNASTAKSGDENSVALEQLADVQGHISEQVSEKFTVDADVVIEVKNNFNVYTATPCKYDLKKLSDYFLKGKEIVNSYEDESYKLFSSADGSLISIANYFASDLQEVYYRTKELTRREMEYLFKDSFGLRWDKHIKFAPKELDFMSISDATKLADNALKVMGITAKEFEAYSVDYAAIQERMEEDKELSGEFYEELYYTKGDEFYIIVPRIELPNGSLLGETTYILDGALTTDIFSSLIYVIVGENGIINICASGLYNITQEQTDINSIVSLEYAYEKIKQEYNVALSTDLRVYKIALTYVPFLVAGQTGTYEIKPAWVFYMTDGTLSHCEKIIDATTGTLVLSKNVFFGS